MSNLKEQARIVAASATAGVVTNLGILVTKLLYENTPIIYLDRLGLKIDPIRIYNENPILAVVVIFGITFAASEIYLNNKIKDTKQ